MRAASLLLLAGCTSSLTVPNPNNPGTGVSTSDPRGAAQQFVTGVLATDRTEFNNFIIGVANFGREGYNIFPTDSRTVTGWYRDANVNSSFSAVDWTPRFANIKTLQVLDNLVAGNDKFTAAERVGTDGWVKTEVALQLLYLITTRNYLGIPVEVDTGTNVLKPFVTRDSAYKLITALLDQGATQLGSSGAAFPFNLTSGYTTASGVFTSPATYLKINRALQARNLVYRASMAKFNIDPAIGDANALYAAALTAVDASYIVPLTAANLNDGPLHLYSTAAGDVSNGLFVQPSNAGEYAHPSITSDGTVDPADRRLNAYTSTIQLGATLDDVTPSGASDPTNRKITRFPQQSSSIPWITNEELHLIRAEALYFTGNTAGAYTELNAVHTISGGLSDLPATVVASDDAFVTALLAERRLSLLLLGHRWADVRRFGRLSTLPVSGSRFKLVANQVVPQAECLAAPSDTKRCVYSPNNTASGL